MFNSGILDVAVGLIFIYLILSLICTAINEMIETGTKRRAADLQRGIRELLQEKEGKGLVEQLYKHPLIDNLFQGDYDPKKTKNLPSYIPSRNFALALIDLVTSPSSLSSKSADMPKVENRLKSLRDAINAMPNTAIRPALMALVNEAGNDFEKAIKNIENWFDSTMERVSGWYTRRVRVITFLVGVAVAIVFNADTITIGTSLSYDVSMRNSLVAASQEYAKADTSLPASPNQQSQIVACQVNENSPECRVTKNLSEIGKLGLPIGWHPDDPRTMPVNPMSWVTKVLGWLLTAFAVSLGAPFWFDLLNNIIIVRSTVRPKEKSPEEPPVNPQKASRKTPQETTS